MFRDIPFTIKRDSRIIDLDLYEFSVQIDVGIVEWNKSTMKSGKAGDVISLKISSFHQYACGGVARARGGAQNGFFRMVHPATLLFWRSSFSK